ncbi:MAG: hypothetical protein EOP62_14310 [Sphingomonadales bacterium]|nr:MAG: hypothetical protein EOP62_14310 [Sphingomonadales bacterium]
MSADSPVPLLPPEEAIAFFKRKGFVFGFSWQDVWQEEHARAFTVAKAMTRDVLETIRTAVDRAIAEGETLDDFRKDLRPKLEKLGWWGRKQMIDPLTAERSMVQLGSPRRLKTIFQVNMRTSYAVGAWERIQRQKAAFPFIRYTSVMDGREREQHHAWHGTTLPVDHPWWDTHYPPCGWNCRCKPQAYSAKMLARRGYTVTEKPVAFPAKAWTNKRTGEVHQIEEGIDPGWSYNVGKAALAGQAPPPLPDSFSGSATASAASQGATLAAFFAPFAMKAGEARTGRVFIDKGGWPLGISLAWLERDGRLTLPAPGRRAQLGLAARTIAEPSEIRWLWITGANGADMLFRRYISLGDDGRAACVVDVGRDGWGFIAREDGRDLDVMRRGELAWSAIA